MDQLLSTTESLPDGCPTTVRGTLRFSDRRERKPGDVFFKQPSRRKAHPDPKTTGEDRDLAVRTAVVDACCFVPKPA